MSYSTDKAHLETARPTIVIETNRALELASKTLNWPNNDGSFANAPAASKTAHLAEFDAALDALEASVAHLRAVYTGAGGS